MKRLVAMVALGAVLVLVGAACGRGAPAAGHGILLVRSLDRWGLKDQIVLWRPGSAPKPLGPAGYVIAQPVWSPDGRSIAYSEQLGYPNGASPTPAEIFVMRADGTHVRQLSSDSTNPHTQGFSDFDIDGPPTWSPDGRYLVYARILPTRPWGDTVMIDARTGHERIVSIGTGAWGKAGFAWAGTASEGFHGVMLINPVTGRSRLIARLVLTGDPSLAWSPTGVLAVTQRKRIVVLAASGRVLDRLPNPSGSQVVCDITWSPNGKQILAWTAKASPNYPAEQVALWVGTVNTKRWRRLPLPITKKNEYACSLSWS